MRSRQTLHFLCTRQRKRITTEDGICHLEAYQLAQPAKINVAIDGPAGAGKSTVARQVAAELAYIYIDTGAMYRAVAWQAKQLGIPATDRERLGLMASELTIELIPSENGQLVIVDGADLTERIRSPEVSRLVPQIAAVQEVRAVLVQLQREIARGKGVVMDGRDIGTHVIPDAEVKIFLTASVEERARRRYEELKARSATLDLTYEQLVHDIAERDRMDQERETAPLVQAPDAVLVDSTGHTVEQVVHTIVNICRGVLHSGDGHG